MDRTAPTILPLNLNHVLGTDAAPFSVDVRSADQISAEDRMRPAPVVEKPGQNRAMCPIKEKESESY
jgi:hypothetical protein